MKHQSVPLERSGPSDAVSHHGRFASRQQSRHWPSALNGTTTSVHQTAASKYPGVEAGRLGSTLTEAACTPLHGLGGRNFSLVPTSTPSAAPASNSDSVFIAGVRDMEGFDQPEEGSGLVDQDVVAPSPPAAPTPPAPPAPQPAQLAPSPALNATIPAHIRSSSTPAGMADRIPPRVDTSINVDVTGWAIPLLPVTFSVEGAGGGNGSATINGQNTVDLTSGATLQLKGVDQTDPGKAGKLRLVATQGGTRLAASGGFSVSAIPQNWATAFASLITGTRRGIRVKNSWESDSGTLADLDEAKRSEQVQYSAGTGSLAGAGAGAQNSGFLPANNSPVQDSHGTPVALCTSAGSITAEQTFIFNDRRTGATNIPATNSGFRISRVVTEPSPGSFRITTSKIGTATTANGFASAAGSGSVSKPQAV